VVRVGLSGTIYVSKLVKDKQKNLNLEGFFGPQVYDISNRTLIDKGVSSEVQITFVRGNKDETDWGSYALEYENLLVKNNKRNKKAFKRSLYHFNKGRTNQLIMAQRHEHIMRLYDVFRYNYPKNVKIEWVHHSRKDRRKVVEDFKSGKVDILIGSMILKRGKNFPKMQYMLNWGGGKSFENLLQLLGRAFRGCKIYEDSWDEGIYLKKHSRRRYTTYKKEKIEVINKHK
jgi:superfamily II DNA or RNA helicase